MKEPANRFAKLISELSWGKKLPDSVYVHADGLTQLPAELQFQVKNAITELNLNDFEYNLIKFAKNGKKLSLLHYPAFWNDDFPALEKSCTIDLASNKARCISYKNSKNPPILHRKEKLLPPKHEKIEEFEKVTLAAEEAQLFVNNNKIGMQKFWLNQLNEKGYTLIDGKLTKTKQAKASSDDDIKIQRHLTAIKRYELSVPIQSLAQYNFLSGQYSIFDYGCGRGDDLRELKAHGIPAEGWDPIFLNNTAKVEADIVNLGFVINVIENLNERKTALSEAFTLTQKLLVVSAMLRNSSINGSFSAYGDGVVTSRGTFQKYYTQQELREFIEDTLDRNAVAVRPGVFFVFKSEEDEQDFLGQRQRRETQWQYLTAGIRVKKRTPHQGWRPKRTTRIEMHQEEIEQFWRSCLEHGRMCHPDEIENAEKIKWIFGTWKNAGAYVQEHFEQDIFEAASVSRREDLLTYLALSFFGKRKTYNRMSKSMKRDFKELFTDYQAARTEAKDLLFSVSNGHLIKEACVAAHEKGIGFLFGSHSFQLHTSLISQLAPILRVYVSCATQLFGDADKADLVKIHLQSKKVSMMIYDEFSTNPVPKLRTRIKINLLEQNIDFFDYENQRSQLLYLKSRYLHPSMEIYEKQKKFDDHLLNLSLFDFTRFGPPAEEFLQKLSSVSHEIFQAPKNASKDT